MQGPRYLDVSLSIYILAAGETLDKLARTPHLAPGQGFLPLSRSNVSRLYS